VDLIKCPGCRRDLRPQAILCPTCGFSFLGPPVEPQEAPPQPWGPSPKYPTKAAEGRRLAFLAAVLGAAALAAPWVIFSVLSVVRPSAFTFVVAWALGPLSIVGSVMAVVLGRRAQEVLIGLSLGGSAVASLGVALGWVGIGLAVLGLVSSLLGIWGGPLNQLTELFRTS